MYNFLQPRPRAGGFLKLTLAILVLAPIAAAQFTQVSGQVLDPHGIPYANGTIMASLVISGSPRFASSGLPYTPPTTPTGLDSQGRFVMQLADVTQIIPAGGLWSFTVNCAAGCIPPAGGLGPVSFTVTGLFISGPAQDISAALQAAAPPLTGGGGGGGGLGNNLQVNGTGTGQSANLNNTTPPAPANAKLIGFQASGTQVSGYFQGDGNSDDCFHGDGNFNPCGVISINGVPGRFTFNGTGVTCVTTTCTFTTGGALNNPIIFPAPASSLASVASGSSGFGVQFASLQTSGIPSFWGLNTGGPGYSWKPMAHIVVNGLDAANVNAQNFNATLPAAPANGINVQWQRAIASNTFSQNISAAIVGDGVATDCLVGTGTFSPCPTGVGGVGAGTVGQFGIYNSTNSIIGSTALSSNGTIITSTESIVAPTFQGSGAGQNGADFLVSSNGAMFSEAGGGSPLPLAGQGGFGFLTGGTPAASLSGQNFKAVQLPSEVNGTQFSNFVTGTNFIGTAPATCTGVTVPTNGRCIAFIQGGPNTGQVSAALVGDGSSNCLSGLGTYVPCGSAGGGSVGPGVVNQMATYNTTSTVAGSNFFTSAGTALTATGSGSIGGFGINSSGRAVIANGNSGNWVSVASLQVNSTGFASNQVQFGAAGGSVTWFGTPTVNAPTNGALISWGIYNPGPLSTGGINAALVGDGVATDCLIGTGTFSPCPGGTGGGVTSINGTPGAFTFTGSGVSCATTTCTFTGGAAGIGGSGQATFLPVFTAASTVADSPITATTQKVYIGVPNPIQPVGTNTPLGSIGFETDVTATTPTCGGLNNVPLTTQVGCIGSYINYGASSGTSSGVNAGMFVQSIGANPGSGGGVLGIGIYGNESASAPLTEERAGYFEAYDTVGTSATTTRRGLMAIAVTGNGHTTALNEGLVAQTGIITGASANTTDYTMHCVAPILSSSGTLGTHACLKIEPQTTGVELQTGAHIFANLPTCTSAYEGSIAAITDSTVTSGTISGGGTTHVQGYCNGSAWVVSASGVSGGGAGGTTQLCTTTTTIGFATNTGHAAICTFSLPAVAHNYIVRCVYSINFTVGATQTSDVDLGIDITQASANLTYFRGTFLDPTGTFAPQYNVTNVSGTAGNGGVANSFNLMRIATIGSTTTGDANQQGWAVTIDGVWPATAISQTLTFFAGSSLAGVGGNVLPGAYCRLD